MPSDKVADEIAMHQKTISSDSNSPLQLIHEKELEISGRLLAAKREADQILNEARRLAAETVAKAESEGGTGSRQQADAIIAKAKADAEELRLAAKADADKIKADSEARKAEAVRLVVDAVIA